MREPWILDNEAEQLKEQRAGRQIEDLKKCNQTYLDRIEEQGLIISRLGSEKAAIEGDYHDMLVAMATMSGALIWAMDWFDEMSSELWDLVGNEGLEEIGKNVFVIEMIDD